MRRIFPSLAFLLAFAPAAASIVELQLVDELGSPFYGVTLELRDLEGAVNAAARVASSDAGGQAVFRDVPPGRYRIEPVAEPQAAFVRPDDNPLAPAPEVTVTGGDEVIALAMELWRGASLLLRVDSDNRGFAGRVVAREAGYRIEATLPLAAGDTRELRVIPGRWEVSYEPPPGFVLTAFRLDGAEVDGYTARVDPAPMGAPAELVWTILSPAEVTGTIVWRGEPAPEVEIEAVLVEPGPWIAEARRRGGSQFEQLTAAVVDDRYTLMLPDGRWRLRPVGDAVGRADPAHFDLKLEPGQYQRVDFVVETMESGGSSLIVELRDPAGAPLHAVRRAVVEAWPLDPGRRGDAPAARVESDSDRITLRGLPPGDLLIVAGHPRFVEGYAVVRGIAAQREETPRVQVSLRRGGTVDFVATDDQGRRVSGVQVTVERQEGGEQPVIDDPRLNSNATTMTVTTDATGQARAVALWPGRWTIDAGWAGADESPRFAAVVVPGEGNDEVEGNEAEVAERELFDGETAAVEIRLQPAAAFRMALVCEDGGRLPATASAVVVPSGAAAGRLPDQQLLRRAVLWMDDLPLRGPLRDRVTVGPLVQDAYHVAVRPTRFQRWSWAPGTEDPERASEFTVFPGSPTELGVITVDCSARAVFHFRSLTDEPLPDLTLAEKAGQVAVERSFDGETLDGRLEWELRADRLTAVGIPAGEQKLRVLLEHPYFLPDGRVDVVVDVDPDRGTLAEFDVDVEGIGGAIRVQGVRGAVAQVHGIYEGAAAVWTQPLAERRAFFPALPAGRYEVILCDDAECLRQGDRWQRIPVDAGSTTVVP